MSSSRRVTGSRGARHRAGGTDFQDLWRRRHSGRDGEPLSLGARSPSLISQRTRAAAPYRASQTDKSPCACWKKSRRWLTSTWPGSRVVVKRNSCRQSPWYPSSSPFYCWATRRHTPRRGVPSTVAGEVERIVASIPFNNAWPRSREMVGSAPRTNSRIPIGVVGRGPVRGELRFGVIALNRRKGCRPPPTTGPLDSGPLTAARRRNAALLQSCWNGPQ